MIPDTTAELSAIARAFLARHPGAQITGAPWPSTRREGWAVIISGDHRMAAHWFEVWFTPKSTAWLEGVPMLVSACRSMRTAGTLRQAGTYRHCLKCERALRRRLRLKG